ELGSAAGFSESAWGVFSPGICSALPWANAEVTPQPSTIAANASEQNADLTMFRGQDGPLVRPMSRKVGPALRKGHVVSYMLLIPRPPAASGPEPAAAPWFAR